MTQADSSSRDDARDAARPYPAKEEAKRLRALRMFDWALVTAVLLLIVLAVAGVWTLADL